MVVVQPACCNQARWTTTNSEYGDFYVSIHKEVKRQSEPVVHKECTKKTDALGKELSDVKAKLECLKQRCQREPCPKTGFILPPGANLNPNLFSPKIGKCHCPSGPGPPNSNPYISICKNEFNGAKQHDPQFLEQHIKTEHPRLVKRVHPSKPYSAPCIVGSNDYFLRDDKNASECGSRSGSKGDSERPRHCKMIGLYKRTDIQCPSRCRSQEKSNSNNMRIRILENSGNNCNSARPNDNVSRPSSDQRYNFYRYYDKQLSGFNLEDVLYDDYQNVQTMHEGYLEEIFPCIKSCILPASNNIISPYNVHSEQCPKFLNSKQCATISNNSQCPNFSNENMENTNFDFCCYSKLFEGEIVNFSASKISNCLESNKKVSKCLKSNKSPISYFKSSKLLPPCFESSKFSTPSLNDMSSKLFNTQGTQTISLTLDVAELNTLTNEDIVEERNKKVQKPRLLCELDMFVEPNYDLFNGSMNGSINGSFKSSSSVNFYEGNNDNEKNEIEETIYNLLKKSWEPRLCYGIEISPQRDGTRYGSFNVSLENEKNVKNNNLECVEIENKQSLGHFLKNEEPREVSFELNFDSKAKNNIDEVDSIEDEIKCFNDINSFQNKENLLKANSNIELDFDRTMEYKVLNNDANYIKVNEMKGFNSSYIIQSTKNEKDSSNKFLSGVNVQKYSPLYSSIKIDSLDHQIYNVPKQKQMPFSTIKLDLEKNQLNDHPETKILSTQDFIFNPLDPLYLNFYVNYDGHCIGQLKMEANTNKNK